MGRKTELTFRVIHRYLGFFLAGIMIIYAISGIVLTFRNTDYLKKEIQIEKTLTPNIALEDLGRALGKGRFTVDKEEGDKMGMRRAKEFSSFIFNIVKKSGMIKSSGGP